MKYRKGRQFQTIGELADWLADRKSVYIHDKYWNNEWAKNLQFSYLMVQVKYGQVFQVLKDNSVVITDEVSENETRLGKYVKDAVNAEIWRISTEKGAKMLRSKAIKIGIDEYDIPMEES